MIQLTIIRIEGYGPWTVTLGSDREAQLQMLQAKIYHDVQRLFSEKNCIVFFNRFDEYFAITNGVSINDHIAIQRELAGLYKDLNMSMAIGVGKTGFAASMAAFDLRKEGRFVNAQAQVFGTAASDDLSAQVMHIDVDSSTKLSGKMSPYEVTALVMKIYSALAEAFLEHEALTFFLGGDNFMVISNGMSGEQADGVIKKATAGLEVKLNCGIGIGRTGRRAAQAATKARDTIRDLRDKGKIYSIYEIRC